MSLDNVLFLHTLLEKNADSADENVDAIAKKLADAEKETAIMRADSAPKAVELLDFCLYLCETDRHQKDLVSKALNSVRGFLLEAA